MTNDEMFLKLKEFIDKEVFNAKELLRTTDERREIEKKDITNKKED